MHQRRRRGWEIPVHKIDGGVGGYVVGVGSCSHVGRSRVGSFAPAMNEARLGRHHAHSDLVIHTFCAALLLVLEDDARACLPFHISLPLDQSLSNLLLIRELRP